MPNKPRASSAVPSPMMGSLIVGLAGLLYFALFFLFSGQEEPSRLTLLFVMPFFVPTIFGEPGQLSATLGLASRLPILLACGLWCGLAYWLARGPVLAVLRQSSGAQHWAIRIPLATLAGLSWLSSGLLLVGWLVGTRSQVAVIGLIGLALAVGWILSRYFRTREPVGQSAPKQSDPNVTLENEFRPDNAGSLWLIRLLRPLAIGLIGFYVLACTHPPVEFDVVEYHLQAPKEFYQLGQIQFLPHNVYANMPLGAEIHALAWMTLSGEEDAWFWGALFGKAIIAAHTLLAAMLVGGVAARNFGRDSGLIAACLLLASGGVIHVSLDGLIDMVVGAYLMAMIALYYLCSSRPIPIPDRSGTMFFLLATYAGATGACKYTGYVLAIAPLCILVLWHGWSERGKDSRSQLSLNIAGLVVGLCLTAVPWLLKNVAETGNPVYPLLSSVFPTPGLNAEQLANWNRVHSPQAAGGYSFMALAESLQGVLWKSPFLNPSVVFFTLAAGFTFIVRLVRKQRRTDAIWWLAILWIFAAWWTLTHRIDRFWFPALPLLAVVSAYGINELARRASVVLVASIGLFGVIFGLLQALSGSTVYDNRIFVDLSTLRASQESPVQYLNTQLTGQDRVLAIGEAKAFPFECQLVYATCFNSNPAENWLRDQPAESQREALQREGITHLFLNWAEIERYRSPGNYGFSDWPTQADIQKMQTDGVLAPIPLPFGAEGQRQSPIELFQVTSP